MNNKNHATEKKRQSAKRIFADCNLAWTNIQKTNHITQQVRTSASHESFSLQPDVTKTMFIVDLQQSEDSIKDEKLFNQYLFSTLLFQYVFNNFHPFKLCTST